MTPILRQLFVAMSTYLAAISLGGTCGYPAVLLQQFQQTDSSIEVDTESASWIASIQGLAGIPSIFMPTIMQIKGRKFAYFTCSLSVILGWTIIFFSKNIITIIIGLFFLGLGSNSLTSIAYLTLSEMIAPKFRSICLLIIGVFFGTGISIVHVLGRYFNWTTVDVIMCAPLVISTVMSFFWVESPAWLSYRKRFDECKESFIKLRGEGDAAKKELQELMCVQKISVFKKKIGMTKRIRMFCKSLLRRDCYMPCFYTTIIIFQMYWGGNIVIYIYTTEMLKYTTTNESAISVGVVYTDVMLIVGAIFTSVLMKYFDSKYVLLASMTGVIISFTLTCLFTLLQFFEYSSKDSLLGISGLFGYITFSNLGITHISFSLPSELIPVKHKSVGGALYVICCSLFHWSVLKSFPYMMQYLGLIGTLLIFIAVLISCEICIWKYVPRSRCKTLQEIERSYNKDDDGDDFIGIDKSVLILANVSNSVNKCTTKDN